MKNGGFYPENSCADISTFGPKPAITVIDAHAISLPTSSWRIFIMEIFKEKF